MPTQYNSPIYHDSRPGIDASCVAILRSAGALIFGKTATVEFASTGRVPPTRNPNAPGRTPGGSSGSAAAVADCQVSLAMGTQTRGLHYQTGFLLRGIRYETDVGACQLRGRKILSTVAGYFGLVWSIRGGSHPYVRYF
jgi:amidase